MKSPSTSIRRANARAALPRARENSRAGFTLLEVLIALAIFAVIFSLGLFVSFDVYRGYEYRSERDVIVALLARARSHAMANLGQSAWGFCEDTAAKSYVIFRGASYAPGALIDESVPASGASSVSGVPACGSGSEIAFAQLSGARLSPLASPTIAVAQAAGPATITVNDEGTIIW